MTEAVQCMFFVDLLALYRCTQTDSMNIHTSNTPHVVICMLVHVACDCCTWSLLNTMTPSGPTSNLLYLLYKASIVAATWIEGSAINR